MMGRFKIQTWVSRAALLVDSLQGAQGLIFHRRLADLNLHEAARGSRQSFFKELERIVLAVRERERG
jgi:hypothetical protein